MKTVGIVGSRTYPNAEQVVGNFTRKLIAKYPGVTIVSGGAIGPDSIAQKVAEEAQERGEATFLLLKPDVSKGATPWEYRAACMARNTDIVNASEIIVAFHNTVAKTSGTLDTVAKALSQDKPVYLYKPDVSFLGPNAQEILEYLEERKFKIR